MRTEWLTRDKIGMWEVFADVVTQTVTLRLFFEDGAQVFDVLLGPDEARDVAAALVRARAEVLDWASSQDPEGPSV